MLKVLITVGIDSKGVIGNGCGHSSYGADGDQPSPS